jgi:hypothetical protein
VPYWLALKAEAWHLAHRTSEALEAIREAKAIAESSEERWRCAELHRLPHGKAAEVNFIRDARGRELRGIPQPKRGALARVQTDCRVAL